MRRRVELIDTSVLLELLRVPYESDRADEAEAGLQERTGARVDLRLPLAAIIETGGHIGKIKSQYSEERRLCAQRFQILIEAMLQGVAPWSFTPVEWNEDFLGALLTPTGDLPLGLAESLGQKHLEMGDLTIIAELRRLRASLDTRTVTVDVWTYDTDLRSTVDVVLARG